ncbi:MAG TPA: HIT family protein [Acidimicrobiales bacterium]|nr:HIT family protein [Acidimicrobiales bacterium]
MSEQTWPEQWFTWRDGDGCPMCGLIRQGADEDEWGARYLAGEAADAYLQRRPFSAGYSVVMFRGRHVADPIDLTDDELAGYWRDVRAAGRAIRAVFGPCHLNYQLLGNSVPHVHTHVIPRYPEDPAPGRPLPVAWEGPPALDGEEFARQLARLRAAAAG